MAERLTAEERADAVQAERDAARAYFRRHFDIAEPADEGAGDSSTQQQDGGSNDDE
jgi:hypothetical protein